ncbi:tetratricopeptide repeat protein [Massilia sp. Leaf139]|uniref:tetratricopeptide repeat protein n=1 Tax=Massilia sp. Leaf139 TaxID=1736272 RepID=UPI000AE25302|nr:tetratricopeptide repeat protein [Massilia sp. Leaf139]
MRTWILSLLVLLAGCAHVGPDPGATSRVAALLNDAAFAPPATPISTDKLFALSPEMRSHLDSPSFRTFLREHGQASGLVRALYDRRELALDYDAAYTGTAAETYAARKGNCLSLVIMTAAFARELGMNVRYQDVQVEDTWTRDRALYFVSKHVNLSLAPGGPRGPEDMAEMLTVDFVRLPPNASTRVRVLDETGIVARYMNNRAAEELAQGRHAEAYWWARGALLKKPYFGAALNTLAVVYQRSGQPLLAEQAYRAALEHEPDSLVVMQNLAPLLAANGKPEEAQALLQRVARLYPAPPYHYFKQGMEAYQAGNFALARTQFAREVARAPYNDEFHFWLGVANLQLGDMKTAQKQLALARDTSVRLDMRERYAAKLAHLRGVAAETRAY